MTSNHLSISVRKTVMVWLFEQLCLYNCIPICSTLRSTVVKFLWKWSLFVNTWQKSPGEKKDTPIGNASVVTNLVLWRRCPHSVRARHHVPWQKEISRNFLYVSPSSSSGQVCMCFFSWVKLFWSVCLHVARKKTCCGHRPVTSWRDWSGRDIASCSSEQTEIFSGDNSSFPVQLFTPFQVDGSTLSGIRFYYY